jgi:hypothetical protein
MLATKTHVRADHSIRPDVGKARQLRVALVPFLELVERVHDGRAIRAADRDGRLSAKRELRLLFRARVGARACVRLLRVVARGPERRAVAALERREYAKAFITRRRTP